MNRAKLNEYVCIDGHRTVTVDIAHGVTFFMINCAEPGCDLLATSKFYPNRLRLGDAKWEWYKPTLEEMKMMDSSLRIRCINGGLAIRKRTKAKPVYHPE